MLTFVTIVHVLLCVFMIFVILLQPGKDAGMGSALGGGAATSAFGGRGAVTFLSKLTGACAAMFFLTSLGLSLVGLRTSVTTGAPRPAAPVSAPAPQAPATPEQGAAPTPLETPSPGPAQNQVPPQQPAAPQQ